MKQRLFIFLFIQFIFCNVEILAQKIDTTFQENSNHQLLDFVLASNKWTKFQVIESDIVIEDGDTIKHKLEVDTFQIKKQDSNGQYDEYEFQLSDKTWRKTLLGKNCNADWWDSSDLPILHFKINKIDNIPEFINCTHNTNILTKGFNAQLRCIENSDDQIMHKYVLEWIADVEDCQFQKQLLLQDAGMIIAHLNSVIPADKPQIRFSIHTTVDSINELKAHYIVSKKIDAEQNTIINISEDAELQAPLLKQNTKLFYDLFKDQIPHEQQKIDSIRLNSIKEFDMTEICIESATNMILKFQRNINSSRLNMDLKPKESRYQYTVSKLSK